MALYLLLLASLSFVDLGEAGTFFKWDYGRNGPSEWANHFPDCAKKSQSPVDICPADASDKATVPFKLVGYGKPIKGLLANGGHDIGFDIDEGEDNPYLSGGILDEGVSYKFLQLHFHWGKDMHSGSEHTVNGKQYPMEMHMVHYNSKYELSDVANHKDGFLVLGFFFDVESHKANKLFEEVEYRVGKLRTPEDSLTAHINLEEIFLDQVDLSDYYSYQGSFTTPPCTEVVTWIVLKDVISLSPKQLDVFRQQVDEAGHKMVDNFRPVLPLHGRKMWTL